MTSIANTVASFVASELMHDGKLVVARDRLLLEEGIIDSLALQQLVAFIEEEFDVVVDDEDLLPENFGTVNAIVALVEKLKHERGS